MQAVFAIHECCIVPDLSATITDQLLQKRQIIYTFILNEFAGHIFDDRLFPSGKRYVVIVLVIPL